MLRTLLIGLFVVSVVSAVGISLTRSALAHCQKLFFDDTEQQKKKLEDELSSRKAFEAYARTAGRRWTGMPQLLLFGGRVLSSLISIMMRSRISCAE